MAGRVEGKVAFITGIARGQGRSHAVRLAEEGADIIGVDVPDQIDNLTYPMATEDDLQDLRRICQEMEASVADPAQFALKDSEFHRRLSETTHNPLMILLLDSIRDMLAEVRALVGNRQGLFERVMPTHKQILEAIAAHNVDGARAAMREHLWSLLSQGAPAT